MPYAILRFAKKKGGSVASCERHNERKKEAYKSNPDIDIERSKLNYHLVEPHNKTYKAETNRLIKEAQCRTRSDSVVMVETLITASNEFITALPAEEQREYFERALTFISERIGIENIISAVVHMDETTPHMHLSFCPITPDKKLSAKHFLGNQKSLSQWQTDFHKCMNSRWSELERGQSSLVTKRKHIPVWLFKLGGRLDKQHEEIINALSDINAFNAGKKRDNAVELLSKWVPELDRFSREVRKVSEHIDVIQGRAKTEKEHSEYWHKEADRKDEKLWKADMRIRNLENTLQKQERILSKIPPEVLAELQKRQKDKGAR